MTIYIRNRRCPCLRCRTRGLMGGAILVTLGVLFLLENYGIFYFSQSWPVLLIVIGLLSFAARNASTEGHLQPSWFGSMEEHMAKKAENWRQSSQDQNNPGQGGPSAPPGAGEVKP